MDFQTELALMTLTLFIILISAFVLFLIIALTCYGSFHYEVFNYIAGFQMYFYLGCLIKKWLDKLDNRYAVLSGLPPV